MNQETRTKKRGRTRLLRRGEPEDADIVAETFERHLNLTPVAVKFSFDESLPDVARPTKALRYCEAVNQVMNTSESLLLDGTNISCPVAKEILGFNRDSKGMMIECVKELLKRNRFTDYESAFEALRIIPRMGRLPEGILLSTGMVSPDIYILYLQPVDFMKLVQAYQRATRKEMSLRVSSVMPICGNCTVRPFLTGRTCVSFGCPDCREYGGLSDDKFAVGMPFPEATLVARSLKHL